MTEDLTFRSTLLLVDDEAANLQILRHTLQDNYRLLFARDGESALRILEREHPDLILLDVMMPGMSGYEVCRNLKANSSTRHIPIIFVTALTEQADEQHGLEAGAVDYITKPFSPPIVRARVKTHLSLVGIDELIDTRLKIIRSLGVAAEYRDNETGMHIMRMSQYAYVLAKALAYSDQAADLLLQAAPMHDVGKIGIPDSILLKPGKLTADEWEVMKSHTIVGEHIIGHHDSVLLRMASRIARHHHEKWDGTGYPDGLVGKAIPHEARIVAVADVFDALTSERPYKKAWDVADAIAYIHDQSGRHFDPNVVAVIDDCLPRFLEIRSQWPDERNVRLLREKAQV